MRVQHHLERTRTSSTSINKKYEVLITKLFKAGFGLFRLSQAIKRAHYTFLALFADSRNGQQPATFGKLSQFCQTLDPEVLIKNLCRSQPYTGNFSKIQNGDRSCACQFLKINRFAGLDDFNYLSAYCLADSRYLLQFHCSAF